MNETKYNNAYIKDIWLELPNYELNREKLKEVDNEKFIGRKELINRLLNSLKYSSGNAAYLITGYRGMGKTVYVERVLAQYLSYRGTVKKVKINFGQKNIREIDIYRQIVKGIKDNVLRKFNPNSIFYFLSNRQYSRFIHKDLITYKVLPFLSILIFPILYPIIQDKNLKSFPLESTNTLLILTAASIAASFILVAVAIRIKYVFFPVYKIYDDLEALYNRCNSNIEEESGAGTYFQKLPLGIFNRKIRKIEIANSKEVESEIIDILDRINKKREFVFVFDEIDKIDSLSLGIQAIRNTGGTNTTNSRSEIQDFKERKGAVINLLASLKYLITTANAKFIFIAGREMFDAALADISDRQSAIGSVFHQVINVDSFLKDISENEKTSGTSNTIEKYLESILLNENPNSILYNDIPFILKYQEKLEPRRALTLNAKIKVITVLQQLSTYLTYRSNGSPKKLTRLIEDLIYKTPDSFYKDIRSKKQTVNDYESNKIYEDDKSLFICQSNDYSKVKNFLKLDYYTQYKIGLINYLYRPIIISFGKQKNSLSDKLLVSTTFLLDHIIKFHSFGFSLQNLELTPEVISEAKSPELRHFIEDLIALLKRNHIRDTEISLFEYRFLNKTIFELTYLSKLFEDESAAFNFTLGENFTVKTHLVEKILEIRSDRINYKIPSSNFVDSIAFLNDRLGDATFYAQEYDEALIAYTDAVDSINQQIQGNRLEFYSTEKFIFNTKLKLKIALTYEKVKAFDSALGTYIEIVQDIRAFAKTKGFKNILSKNDLMQFIIQPFLAKIYIIEKTSVVGITVIELFKIYYEVKKIVYDKFTIKSIGNDITISSFHSQIGTLLFYKNITTDSYTLFLLNELSDNSNWNITTNKKIKKERESLNSIKSLSVSLPYFRKLIGTDIVEALESSNSSRSIQLRNGYRISELPYIFYEFSLRILLNRITKVRRPTNYHLIDMLYDFEKLSGDTLPGKLNYKKRDNDLIYSTLDTTYYRNVAVSMFKVADLLLSNITSTNIIIQQQILHHDLFYALELPVKTKYTYRRYWSFKDFKSKDTYNKFSRSTLEESLKQKDEYLIQLVLCLYFWSAQYYLRAGKYLAASFQYRKILETSRLCLGHDTLKKYIPLFEKFFFVKCIYYTTVNSSTTNRFQIFKQKYQLGISDYETPKEYMRYIYLNQSTSPEVKEVILIMLSIYHYCKTQTDTLDNILSPYSILSSQYIRIKELHLQYRVNKKYLEEHYSELIKEIYSDDLLDLWKRYKSFTGSKDEMDEEVRQIKLEFHKRALTRNCSSSEEYLELIFSKKNRKKNLNDCLNDILVTLCNTQHALYQNTLSMQQYRPGYFITYSDLGDVHRRLGEQLKISNFLKLIIMFDYDFIDKDRLFDIEKNLGKYIGLDTVKTIDATSQFQIAYQNYLTSIKLHSEGDVYKNQMYRMYYLEDDYNDSLFHYCISRERYKIASGVISNYLDQLSKEIDQSKIHDIESYIYDMSHSI